MEEQLEKVMLGPEAASRFRRVRYAYVILALLSFLAGFTAVEISLAAIRNNNQNFCDLMGSLSYPAPAKPADPKTDLREERTWVVYNKIVRLDHRLGCEKKP